MEPFLIFILLAFFIFLALVFQVLLVSNMGKNQGKDVTITVQLGDFLEGSGTISHPLYNSFSGRFILRKKNSFYWTETIEFSQLESVFAINEESSMKRKGTLENRVTFKAKFKDGRELLATTDNLTFTRLESAAGYNDGLAGAFEQKPTVLPETIAL